MNVERRVLNLENLVFYTAVAYLLFNMGLWLIPKLLVPHQPHITVILWVALTAVVMLFGFTSGAIIGAFSAVIAQATEHFTKAIKQPDMIRIFTIAISIIFLIAVYNGFYKDELNTLEWWKTYTWFVLGVLSGNIWVWRKTKLVTKHG